MKKKFQIVCLCMFVFALLVAGCGGSSTKKELIVGTEPAFAPFEFQNTDNEYVGIDIDLLKEIAADQQFEVNFRPLGFNSSIQGVISNQLDGMIAGMSITEERKKTFDF